MKLCDLVKIIKPNVFVKISKDPYGDGILYTGWAGSVPQELCDGSFEVVEIYTEGTPNFNFRGIFVVVKNPNENETF